MNTRFLGFALTIALLGAASSARDIGSLSAQTAAAPKVERRTPKVQSAWPPRTPDGQPDIQGVWFNEATGMVGTSVEPMTNLRQFNPPTLRSTSTSYTGGYRPKVRKPTALVDPPTLILPYQPWALARRNSVLREYTRPSDWSVDPNIRAWPAGVPRIHVYSGPDGDIGGPWQVMQGPGYVLFLYETQHEFRYVPINSPARAASSGTVRPGDDVKLWMGSSRGHWEENTLVIETTNHNDSTRFSMVGDFHSDELRVTERFTYKDKDTLEYTATITDPKVYTQPWTIALTNKRSAPGTEIMEYAGVEGEFSVKELNEDRRRKGELPPK
jgi:hypothetical protein